jgi:hypothetical protein
VPLRNYVIRLIVTGNDSEDKLSLFFGPTWKEGDGTAITQERRNLAFNITFFTLKGLNKVYDLTDQKVLAFSPPNATEEEIAELDKLWGDSLAWEEWMVGARRL